MKRHTNKKKQKQKKRNNEINTRTNITKHANGRILRNTEGTHTCNNKYKYYCAKDLMGVPKLNTQSSIHTMPKLKIKIVRSAISNAVLNLYLGFIDKLCACEMFNRIKVFSLNIIFVTCCIYIYHANFVSKLIIQFVYFFSNVL